MTSIARWGNSLAVRIPRNAAAKLGLAEGASVEVVVEDGALVVRPLAAPAIFDLEALLDEITAENLHGETVTGFAVGNEL